MLISSKQKTKKKSSQKIFETLFLGFYFALISIFSNFAANWLWELFGEKQISLAQIIIGGGSTIFVLSITVLLFYKYAKSDFLK